MSKEYEGQDPIQIALKAEKDLNSTEAKSGSTGSDSTNESGIDQGVTTKFPGSTAEYGSAVSGAGDNREIPVSEGGEISRVTGQPTKASDFEGLGGPEDKARAYAEAQGGENDVRGNIRQGGDTIRPS